jgi:hypothetical protein
MTLRENYRTNDSDLPTTGPAKNANKRLLTNFPGQGLSIMVHTGISRLPPLLGTAGHTLPPHNPQQGVTRSGWGEEEVLICQLWTMIEQLLLRGRHKEDLIFKLTNINKLGIAYPHLRAALRSNSFIYVENTSQKPLPIHKFWPIYSKIAPQLVTESGNSEYIAF